MAPSKPNQPPPRTIPRRFQSKRPQVIAGMAAQARAREIQSLPESASVEKAVERPPSPVQVVERVLTEEQSTEPPAREVPSIEARPAKTRPRGTRPAASQIARVPKQPIRTIKSRAAFHAAVQAKNATSKGRVWGNKEVQQAEVIREPLRSLRLCAGGDGEDAEGNHVNGLDDNDNQFQLEMDDDPGQNEEEQEGKDDQLLVPEGTRRHGMQRRPGHKYSSKVSKPKAQRQKKHRRLRVDELELAAERLSLDAEEELSDDEPSCDEEPRTKSHMLPRLKRRKPDNVHHLDNSEYRIPKEYDTAPSPCSDGFVGKEASPTGLVMRVGRSGGRRNCQGKGQKSTLRLSELVIGENRHQEERKLKKNRRKMLLMRRQQSNYGNHIVGLEDDPIMTATSVVMEDEQEDEDVFDIAEQIPGQMIIDSEEGHIEDHVPQINDNNDSENGDFGAGNQLLTPSTEHTNSSHIPLVDLEQIQEANGNNLLVAAEEPPRPDSADPLEGDHAMDEETSNTPCLEEVTNNSDIDVDLVDDEGKNEAEADDGEDTCVPREPTPTWSETYTERSNTESRSDRDASDESSVQDNNTSSDTFVTSDDEDESLPESSERMRDSDEEVHLDQVATTVALEQNLSEDTDSGEEADFNDVALNIAVERTPSEHPDSDEEVDLNDVAATVVVEQNPGEGLDSDDEVDLDDVPTTVPVERDLVEGPDTAPEALDQQDDEIMVDVDQVAGEETESPCSACSKMDEEPVMPIEQVLGDSAQDGPMDIYERDSESAERVIAEEAQAYFTEAVEGNDTVAILSEGTQFSSEVVCLEESQSPLQDGDGDEAMLLLENQGVTENSSPEIEKPRLGSLPSEIVDSYPQSESDGSPDIPSASILQEKASEALLILPPSSVDETRLPQAYVEEPAALRQVPSEGGSVENPRLGTLPSEMEDSYPRDQSNDPSELSPSVLPTKESGALLMLHPSSVNEPFSRQVSVEETIWRPRVPSHGGSMEVIGDEIVDSYSPPSSQYKASRRRSSVARTKSLTLIRTRPSPGPEEKTAGYSQGQSSISFGSQSQYSETQDGPLSNLSSEQKNIRRMSSRPIKEILDPRSRESEGDQLLFEQSEGADGVPAAPEFHSSQPSFVPEAGSYFSRASQDLHAPARRLATRSKSMFVSSSSCLTSQRSENSSQTSYDPQSSQAISVAPRTSFSRLPTLREGGEKPKILKGLTRKASVAHGTTPNTGKKRMVSLPFTPPFLKWDGNERSARR